MAITTTTLNNAELDLATIAEVAMVDYTSDTTTNRDGDSIYTLQGMLKLLGYRPAVAYAGGISFTTLDITKTIERSGIIYAPLVSALPFTTSSWSGVDDAKFVIIQTAVDLAAANISFDYSATSVLFGNMQTLGAALVTYIDNLCLQTGRGRGSTSMGTFTGNILTDNTTIVDLLQELADYVEAGDDTKANRMITTYSGSVNGNIAVTFSPAATYPPIAGQIYAINYSGAGGGSNLTKLRIHASDSYRTISKLDGTALSSTDIASDHLMVLMFNGTEYILLNPWNPKHDETYNESVGQVYAADTTLTFTTNLGIPNARNFNCNVVLTCNTTDAGYAVGDSIIVCSDQGTSGFGCQVYVPSNGNSVCVAFAASGLKALHKTTRTATTLTDSYWDVYINITSQNVT